MNVGVIMNKTSRNLGLDIARSMAIILVLISHAKSFSVDYNLQFLGVCGLLGVEIFFVLSGFLIGTIIIKNLVNNPSINSLKEFYIRRWFRTLPLYYLILFLTAIISHSIIPKRNFIFLQNFNEHALNFLAVSWSLSVEEWFYLLFPLILVICLKIFEKKMERKKIFFIISISIAMFSLILRLYIVYKYNPSWDYGIRKQVFLRMDSMMFGVILAGINIYYKNMYRKFIESKLSIVLSVIGFTMITQFYIWNMNSGKLFDESIFSKTFLFSLISFICISFIAWMESSIVINKKLIKYSISKLFNFISSISYVMYFVHWIVYGLMLNILHGWKGACLAIIITLLVSWLLHILYEVPIMNLRDKIDFRKKNQIIAEVKI